MKKSKALHIGILTIVTLTLLCIILSYDESGDMNAISPDMDTIVPGTPAEDNVSEVFYADKTHYYITFGGTVRAVGRDDVVASLPNGRGKWAEGISEYLYIDVGSLYKWSPSDGIPSLVAQDIDAEYICMVTDSFIVLQDRDFALYRVALDGYEISKLAERKPGEIIASSGDYVFMISENYNTVYELNVRDGGIKELVTEASSKPIVFASVYKGNLFYVRHDENKVQGCRTSNSQIQLSDIQLPQGMSGRSIIGFAFSDGYTVVARAGHSNIHIYTVAAGEPLLLQEQRMYYSLPGSFILSVSDMDYCFAVSTGSEVFYGRLENRIPQVIDEKPREEYLQRNLASFWASYMLNTESCDVLMEF